MLALSAGMLSPGTSAHSGNRSYPRPGVGLGQSNIGPMEFAQKGQELVTDTTLSVYVSLRPRNSIPHQRAAFDSDLSVNHTADVASTTFLIPSRSR